MASYDITTDDELTTRVRALSQYADDPQELPSGELSTLVADAKREIHLRTDSNKWYDDASGTLQDRGLTQALLGLTLVKAKNAVENYSVSAWDVLGQTINVTGVADTDASQFEKWIGMMDEGLAKSSQTDEGDIPTNINSTSYIG